MRTIEPVSVSKGGFEFCKYGIAALLWLAVISPPTLKISLVALTTTLLTLSALVGVDHAPMIKLFDWSFGRLLKTEPTMLDKRGMRFAHGIGAVLNGATLLLLLLWPKAGIGMLLVVAILKTISAVGFCPGLKLYQCLNSDTCCKTGKSLLIFRKRRS